MADEPGPLPSSEPSRAGRPPLDELEGEDPFGNDDPFGGGDPFEGGDPFGGGAPFSENDSPLVLTAKLWIIQNPLLSVGAAFAAGTLIGVLKR